jgi:hypothetical protein
MIISGTHPPIHIDLGNNKPGMTLPRQDREGGTDTWVDYLVDGEVVKSPVDIDELPMGFYWLV